MLLNYEIQVPSRHSAHSEDPFADDPDALRTRPIGRVRSPFDESPTASATLSRTSPAPLSTSASYSTLPRAPSKWAPVETGGLRKPTTLNTPRVSDDEADEVLANERRASLPAGHAHRMGSTNGWSASLESLIGRCSEAELRELGGEE